MAVCLLAGAFHDPDSLFAARFSGGLTNVHKYKSPAGRFPNSHTYPH